MDANKLINKIIDKGYKIYDISDSTSVHKTRIYDVNELTIGEVLALKNILELSDSEAISIFLGA